MDSPAISSIEALNAAIKSHNPFTNTGVVKEQNIWGKGFPDLPTLNAHASDAVFHAIEQVRTSQYSQEKVTSIAITAQQGVGKSHIISRIRHRLERQGGALFVYASLNNYADLNLIKYQFQQTLADSLSYTASQGVMQWQEIATAMANEGFKAIDSNVPSFSPEDLVNRFDKVYAIWLAKEKNLMNTLTKQVLKAKPHADPYIVRAILWTLSETQSPFAIKWLSGDDLAQSNAEELGLPNPSKTSQLKEAEALNTVQQILNLVGEYNPVIICFDEIDIENKCTDDGLTTPLAIADLVKRMYDTLRQSEIGQGVIILTVMLPDTWIQKVDLMPGGTPDRVSTYTQRKPIDLKYIDSDSMVELVKLWLKEFYEARNLTPHHPVYPFEESQLREFGRRGLTVREALRLCAENFQVPKVLPPDPFERFELALIRELEVSIENYIEDNFLIADALYFGFQTLRNKTMEGITIEDVVEGFGKRGVKDKYINFKIVSEQNGKIAKIGVAVLQSSHHNSLGAGLERLTDYKTFDITRGCLVRSQDKKFNLKSEAYKLLERLTSKMGGELVELIEEQIKPLLAVHFVYQKRGDYDLTEEQVFDFISQKQLTFDNPLLRKILSDPSGQMPLVDDEDDRKLLDDFLNPSSMNDTDDSAALISDLASCDLAN